MKLIEVEYPRRVVGVLLLGLASLVALWAVNGWVFSSGRGPSLAESPPQSGSRPSNESELGQDAGASQSAILDPNRKPEETGSVGQEDQELKTTPPADPRPSSGAVVEAIASGQPSVVDFVERVSTGQSVFQSSGERFEPRAMTKRTRGIQRKLAVQQLARGELSFLTRALDLGEVPAGTTARATFRFVNEGAEPIEISNVETASHLATITDWSRRVEPGEEGALGVEIHTDSSLGLVEATVMVECGRAEPVRLTVKASIWSPLKMSANSVRFRDLFFGGDLPAERIELTAIDGEAVGISSVHTNNPYFRTALRTLKPERRFELTVYIPELEESIQRGTVTLHLNHPEVSRLTIPVFSNGASLRLPATSD